MKKCFFVLVICVLSSAAMFGQTEARWLRYPAISPDGQSILFGYMGNIYKVNVSGGVAAPVTTGSDYNSHPVWSHDGKTIAFASDKSGNFDVYTMSANGGVPMRLTYNSAADYPQDFTADNKFVLFNSPRNAPAKSVRFPSSRLFYNIYTVPVGGGRPILVSAAGMDVAHYNYAGTKIVFQDRKGYEDDYRKHHVSPVTRDIWIYNIPDNQYSKVTNFKGEDLAPVFASDDNSIYYTSEQDGTLNVYKRNVSSGTEMQMTHFKGFPVRDLSISANGTLAFVWKGDIYTMRDGSQPQKVAVAVADDAGYQASVVLPLNGVTEFEVSPNGKEVAFINRGELFVSGVKDARTKRITNTPWQERMICWSHNGKYLFFSAEREGKWGIYKVSLKDTTEKYFYASTLLNEEPVVVNDNDNFQPLCSPDNKKLAYVCERNVLKVMDLASGKTVTVLPKGHNHSYADGDWGFKWSPDSKWLLVDDSKDRMAARNTALVKADGTGEIKYPVNSGFGEFNADWALKGEMMVYLSTRAGNKSLAGSGADEPDVYGIFFDQKAYDRYMLSKEDYELLKEKEKAEKADKAGKKDGDKAVGSKKGKGLKAKKDGKAASSDSTKVEDITFDWNNIEERKVRLTSSASSLEGYAFNKDASKIYYLANAQKGSELWVTDPREKETKVLAKLSGGAGGLGISDDDATLFTISGGSLMSIDAKSGEIKPIALDAKMELNKAGERAYIYDHAWAQVVKKFYDPKIHGIDWKMYHDEYAKFLPYINNNYDFQALLSELLGELNASHTGGRYYAPVPSNADRTASLGFLFDETYKGPGIKVSAIIPGGISDRAENKVKAGDVITAINGVEIKADENWNKYLLNVADVNSLLTVKSGIGEFEQRIRPVSVGKENYLLYKRWIKTMEHMVDSLSNGKVGYVHVEGMDDASFREVYENALGKNIDKQALIVDTRFNGGGWLHDDLNTFLSGHLYMKYAPQGNVLKDGEPIGRWIKPSIVLMSESNYSDAFMFPFIYQQNKTGKLVGMPVAGTGTAVWWETQIDPTIIFGIPMIGSMGTDGKITENKQVNPDIQVELPYNDFLNGKDPQLEAAVKEMLK
ncbi:MAG: S41 family peptidase [Bacteroidales bacterium]|nr:S41 family peptidase [Bacteroidales bacterium]